MASRPDRSRRRALAAFAGLAAAALIAVMAGSVVASQRAGEREAVANARDKTELLARLVVEPNIASGLVEGDPAARAAMDELVGENILGPDIARVKIWSADGTIIYSDDPRLIGARYGLGEEELEVLSEGGTEAELTDLTRPENRFEQSYGEMLEVYLPISTPEGQTLLFETYSPYAAVTASARSIWTAFAPISIGGLILFAALMAPLAWRLATRVQRDQQEKARLLQSAIDASELERGRIAADLHDGVVQDLSGVALTLAAVGSRLPAGDDSAAVRAAGVHTRGAVSSLRSLLVEIYPPSLREAGLDSAITGLTASLQARGIESHVRVAPGLQLPDETEALVFRVAQEAIRNVMRHSQASTVTIDLLVEGSTAVLSVADNGVGVDGSAPADSDPGHVGLRLLKQAAEQASGTLILAPRADGPGTVLQLKVPFS